MADPFRCSSARSDPLSVQATVWKLGSVVLALTILAAGGVACAAEDGERADRDELRVLYPGREREKDGEELAVPAIIPAGGGFGSSIYEEMAILAQDIWRDIGLRLEVETLDTGVLRRPCEAVSPEEWPELFAELMPAFQADAPILFLMSQVITHVVDSRFEGLSTPYRADPVGDAEHLRLVEGSAER